ncbi:MAG: CRISPR-associated endonuclease Cas1 [Bacteroidota bacterium]|nr:CRISPR-associated endonuclease Cas1 [Candidatus Kapabacteria bacterium]MDW8221018.1 CRISPR-associated endonuclease Cas1 [Bacteroidota bacterium]
MHLTISTFGAYLHVSEALFEVRIRTNDGVKKQQFMPKKLRSIVVERGVALSSEAIMLALTHNIDIVVVQSDGQPAGRFWHSKLGSTTKIRKRQLEVSIGTEAVEYIKHWIVLKLERQLEFLADLKRHREGKRSYIDEQRTKIEEYRSAIVALEATTVADIAELLRAYEGNAGRVYFATLSELISAANSKYAFSGRSKRPAKDPFNAFLNYAYGILYRIVERAIMIAGLDPYIGFMHRDDYNHLSFVFDFIEPYRPFADEVVFRLFSAKKVNQSHTENIANGVALTKEGKQLLSEHMYHAFEEETIRYRGKNRTRSVAILHDAHTFANTLLAMSTNSQDLSHDSNEEEVVV